MIYKGFRDRVLLIHRPTQSWHFSDIWHIALPVNDAIIRRSATFIALRLSLCPII